MVRSRYAHGAVEVRSRYARGAVAVRSWFASGSVRFVNFSTGDTVHVRMNIHADSLYSTCKNSSCFVTIAHC